MSVPLVTWDQTLAEGVHQHIPESGVTVAGGSWPPEGAGPEEPVDPPVFEGCDTMTQYIWGQKMEVDLSQASCIVTDRDLAGRQYKYGIVMQMVAVISGGTLSSVDGSSSISVTSNYVSSNTLTGKLVQIKANNNCQYVSFRSY
ncbi:MULTISPECIES: hypothetical protein [Vibrio]|uniref:hypothetical protein n=1 Tax=Vibrio TaxID=662 RepID=UPI0006197303|nr:MULTISPECIES: hypothetical protein [Vibrio]